MRVAGGHLCLHHCRPESDIVPGQELCHTPGLRWQLPTSPDQINRDRRIQMTETTLGFDELVDPETLQGLDGRELAELFKRLEQLRRRVEGALAAVIGAVNERGVHTGDGHSNVNGWCRALGRWSDTECRDRVRTANLIASCDRFRDAVMSGEIGVAQVPRVGAGVRQPALRQAVGGCGRGDGRQRHEVVASRVPHHRATVGDAGRPRRRPPHR